MDKITDILKAIDRFPKPAFVMGQNLEDGEVVNEHRHEVGQLLHTQAGILRATTSKATWTIPPGRGLWIPPQCTHNFKAIGQVQIRTLFTQAQQSLSLPNNPVAILITPLIRELLSRAAQYNFEDKTETAVDTLVIPLLLNELREARSLPLGLQLPSASKLKHFAQQVLSNPTDRRSMTTIARELGLSPKTFSRHFTKETGMTPDAWRRHARMLEALHRLESGERVTTVAYTLGYQSLSTFSETFKGVFGVLPRSVGNGK